MKKHSLFIISVLSSFALVSLFFSGCENALTDSVTTAEAIEGEWRVEENSEFYSGTSSYQVYIGIAPNDSSKVVISNFYQLGYDAEVTGNISGNRIELDPNQLIDLSGVSSYVIKQGGGTVSDDYQRIEWQYQVDDGSGVIDNADAIYTKL